MAHRGTNSSHVEINRGPRTSLAQSGIGQVVVPDNDTREEYIANCYRTQTVTLQGGWGYGYLPGVRVLSTAMQQLRFPLTAEQRGSTVFWVRENFTNRAVVVGVLPDEDVANMLTEGQTRSGQEVDGRTTQVFQDATTGTLTIAVQGDPEHPAHINIRGIGGGGASAVAIDSDGTVTVAAPRVTVNAEESIQVRMADENDETLFELTAVNDEDDGAMLHYEDTYENTFDLNRDSMKYADQFDNEVTIEDGKVTVKGSSDVEITADSKKVTVNAQEINLNTDSKLDLDSGKEPMVLGDTLKNLLNDLLTALEQLTVVTSVGTSSVPVNVADFVNIQGQLQTILSTKSNLE